MKTIKTQKGFQLDGIEVDAKPYSTLPTQQARTLLFVAHGMTQKNIAAAMGVKVSTVKKAVSNLSFRFNSFTMRETVCQAIKQGVLRYNLCLLIFLLSFGNVERHYTTTRTVRVQRCARTKSAITRYAISLAAQPNCATL